MGLRLLSPRTMTKLTSMSIRGLNQTAKVKAKLTLWGNSFGVQVNK